MCSSSCSRMKRLRTDGTRQTTMAMIFKRVCLGTVLIGAAARLVSAQTLSLTLEDAIDRGVAQAPRLAEARAREAAANSTVAARASLGAPSVIAMTGYLRTNHVDEFGIPQPNGT